VRRMPHILISVGLHLVPWQFLVKKANFVTQESWKLNIHGIHYSTQYCQHIYSILFYIYNKILKLQNEKATHYLDIHRFVI
jgi:hypothetical protein